MGCFPIHLKNIYTLFWVEVVSDLAYEFCYCVDISVNPILEKSRYLVQWHRDLFLGNFKGLCTAINQKIQGTWCSDNVIVYSRSLKIPRIIKTQQNTVPWCSDTKIFVSGSFKQLIIIINRNIWNQHVLWVWAGCKFFKLHQKFYLLNKILSRMCLFTYYFFTIDISVFIQLVVTIRRSWRCWRSISGVVKYISI